MTADFVFAPPSSEDLQAGTLGRALREYNYRFVDEYPQSEPVRLDARDAQGRLAGGIRAFVMLSWLHTDVLWVAEDRRGQGLGRQLLCWAETQGKALGARHAKLETFEWQAREFYVKQGYAEYARIEDYVPGFYLAQMKKSLA